MDSRFQTLADSEFLKLNTLIQSPEFCMPQAERFQIPESGLAYMDGGTRDVRFREVSA